MHERLKLRCRSDSRSVQQALMHFDGLSIAVEADDLLVIHYDFPQTSAAAILRALDDAGIERRHSPFERLKLLLRCYREANERENLNNEIGWDSFVREIYVSRYRHRRHGRRDDRPRHWRQYSNRRGLK